MIIKSKDIKENLIKYSQSIYDAIYKINLIKLKFLLVVNLNNSVVGTITDGDLRRALVNHKDLNDNFMSMAFETTLLGRKNLKAAIHPSDFTIRPQTVRKKDNEEYYNLLKSFKKITKVGALLNTSLNLHGMPIAMDYIDALYILDNSDLDAMVFDKVIISKK